MKPEPGDGTLCSVDGCENEGLLAETRRPPSDGGLSVWIVFCGPHLKERKERTE